jgi:hypothetical protein
LCSFIGMCQGCRGKSGTADTFFSSNFCHKILLL